MRVEKLIWFYLVSFVALLGSSYLLFKRGVEPLFWNPWYFYDLVVWGVGAMLVVFLVLALVSFAYAISRVLYRKNLLRISLIFLVILTLVNIIQRIMEISWGTWNWAAILVTLIYIVMCVQVFLMLKEFHSFIKKLFEERYR